MHKFQIFCIMNDQNHLRLLAQVASMYYDEGMTQNAIGKELALSRVKVYRLLKQAREKQVVQIVISWPIERDKNIEKALDNTFGLDEALVLRTTPHDNTSSAFSRLGQMGSGFLEQVLKDGMTLTVCLGRSTYEVVNAISPGFRANIHVAQAMGSMPFAKQEMDSAALARLVAQKLGGQVLYLSSPMMADSLEAATVLRSQDSIKRTLTAASEADIALLGIGNLDPRNSGFVKAGLLTAETLMSLAGEGAVGEIGGQFFTQEGKPLHNQYSQRMIGLTLAEFARIPTTIAVAMGQAKAKAILGALRSNAINVLITDGQAASEVLALSNQEMNEN
jgi:DNA-binding transcriptional regulator LsrR (DeoR family)